MKLYHFSILFVIFIIVSVTVTEIKTNNLKAVFENKNQIDNKLDKALDDGVARLAMVDDNNGIITDKSGAMNSLFLSLYATFDVFSDKESQERLNLYIPVVVVTEEEGYYIFYSDEYLGADGFTYTAKRWSEKFPYYYEDEDFIYGFTLGDIVKIYDKNKILGGSDDPVIYSADYHDFQTEDRYAAFRVNYTNSFLLNDESYEIVQKGAIIECLQESMAYYVSHHNKIAQLNGITYNFALPVMSEADWASYIDNIGMMVLFQGYPYGSDSQDIYNRIASAGAKVSKREVYYLEQKGWYLIYHTSVCKELSNGGMIDMETPYYDKYSCIQTGAYACPICIKSGGVTAPQYSP